jgi:hypothetical protein
MMIDFALIAVDDREGERTLATYALDHAGYRR